MKTLHLVLGDQLSMAVSSLRDLGDNSVILMCETAEDIQPIRHHKKKLVFLFAARRHFASKLQKQHALEYVRLDDPENTGSLCGEVERAIQKYNVSRVVVTHPSEYALHLAITQWSSKLGVAVDIRADDRFLCAPEEFQAWAGGRSQVRMEYFYREMRKKHRILMDGDQPCGGQWNYDANNRKPPKEGMQIPKPYTRPVDATTQEVIAMVEAHCGDYFGDIAPFYFALEREEALEVLQLFIDERLHCFGDFQDAMIEGEPWMYHSHISFYLNCGLLNPLECIQAAEQAYRQQRAPLNAVEGFIRQILGWREYIRGIYWLKMPGYAADNFLEAKRALPQWYWTGKTRMNCLSQCITETKQNAYAHHIQRLMVLGNFALLAGIDPTYVNEWYLIVYADAYEWVELPNVSGMILFADGGYLASKPYAAGGSYINKMSNYCRNCSYKVQQKNGKDACPFNYLYWDFLNRNRDKLSTNPRVGMMYRTWDRMSEEKKNATEQDSAEFLQKMEAGDVV